MIYESETEVKTELKNILVNYTDNFEIIVYEREELNASRYKASFAVRMNTDDINEQMISDIKRLNAREGKKILFDSSKVDLQGDFAITFLIVSAEIKCNL